ncbi:hypothetical protein BOX15_Mlig012276g1 [Macrostomum lignano]|uniref:FZ domain-containing protein n=1 Tax=Macrostomum lignano TaxID=282301 RepID=A0A267H7W9_9PLAT|nr:hypothetical protein BOX15_Mlig012276g1 [Macrostomum lignano]
MPCCVAGGACCGGSEVINNRFYCRSLSSNSVDNNASSCYRFCSERRRRFSRNSSVIIRFGNIFFCLLIILIVLSCLASASEEPADFLSTVLSICPKTFPSRTRRSQQSFDLSSATAEVDDVDNSTVIALTNHHLLIIQLCQENYNDNNNQSSESELLLLARLLNRFNRSLYRVPNCRHLPVQYVLPQFYGCSNLTAILTKTLSERNLTAVRAVRSLACDCIDRLLIVSAELEFVLENFHLLVDRIYFTKSSVDRAAHQRQMQACQTMYRDWLCSVKFNVYDINDSLTQVNPCSEWCQSVETECPYLTPSDDFSNAGEPVFLCHEDSYKGTRMSDRCTGYTQCCCYAPSSSNRTNIKIMCTSPASLGRKTASSAASDSDFSVDFINNANLTDSNNATNSSLPNVGARNFNASTTDRQLLILLFIQLLLSSLWSRGVLNLSTNL